MQSNTQSDGDYKNSAESVRTARKLWRLLNGHIVKVYREYGCAKTVAYPKMERIYRLERNLDQSKQDVHRKDYTDLILFLPDYIYKDNWYTYDREVCFQIVSRRFGLIGGLVQLWKSTNTKRFAEGITGNVGRVFCYRWITRTVTPLSLLFEKTSILEQQSSLTAGELTGHWTGRTTNNI
ncbi:hypothetical protein RF11_13272 [Thelohanellus kitauei]|uniref:Uncharacterized protein n=1 Tax=Thelohanellus kitauei TaxID=669202 RepID=A0A0C2N8C2_THEKT|nr:hypothetical protein RF11_13272 [Thelohanellus kitauei]